MCVYSGVRSCGTLEMWVTISEPSGFRRDSQSTPPACNLSYAVYPNNQSRPSSFGFTYLYLI